MRFQPLALVTLLAAFVAVAPAEDLKKIAEANEQAFVHAMKTKNLAGLQKITARDYHEREANGRKISRSRTFRELKKVLRVGMYTKMVFKVLKVDPMGRGILVHVASHAVFAFQSPGAKRVSKLIDDNHSEQFWVKAHGRWAIHWAKVINDKQSINGKPIH